MLFLIAEASTLNSSTVAITGMFFGMPHSTKWGHIDLEMSVDQMVSAHYIEKLFITKLSYADWY